MTVLLLDNSAWARRRHPAVRERLAEAMESGELAVCLPFLLEAGYSARSEADHAAVTRRLALLARVELSPEVEALSLEAQQRLAAVGHHRLPPSDIVIAACAHHAGMGVLHYDRDYDLVAEHTQALLPERVARASRNAVDARGHVLYGPAETVSAGVLDSVLDTSAEIGSWHKLSACGENRRSAGRTWEDEVFTFPLGPMLMRDSAAPLAPATP